MNKLCFLSELDINIPNLDNFDIDKFYSETAVLYNNTVSEQIENNYRKNINEVFPWKRRILMLKGDLILNLDNYQELIPVLDLSKELVEKPSISLIYQIDQPVADFDFHFDGSNTGYRICYGLSTEGVFLEFSRLKKEFLSVRSGIKNYMLEDRVYSLIPKKKNTLLSITEEVFPHRVPYINAKYRYVFAVIGNFKPHEYKSLQELSETL